MSWMIVSLAVLGALVLAFLIVTDWLFLGSWKKAVADVASLFIHGIRFLVRYCAKRIKNPFVRKVMPADDWTEKWPRESGIYWYWNGLPGCTPDAVTVVAIGDTGAIMTINYQTVPGTGWWKRIPLPEVPKLKGAL